MPHVFLSYSRKDTDFVGTLERDLNARGIATWRDTSSIVGGEEWYKAIVRGIHDAYAMVTVVTPASDLSKWVLREGLYADQKGLPIIPVLPVPHSIPFHLVATQPVSCEDYSAGLTRLVASLETIHRSATATVGPAPTLGPADRDTELAYLDFVLSEMKAELRTARYVNLGATRENTVLRKPSPSAGLDEFEMSFDRFEPLVKAERLQGEDLDRAGEPVEDARDPLREMKRAILLGEPGSGKTTTLQQLAIDRAHAAQDDPAGPLPVFVPLRSYQGGEPFSEFVRGQLGPLQSQYERLLAEGRLMLLCDALNEMQRHANGRDLVDEVRGYLRDRQPWVVSCRVRDYQEELQRLRDVSKVRLKPLDLPRIKDVIDRRFHDKPERAAALWTDLKGSDDLLAAWRAFEAVDEAEAFWTAKGWPNILVLSWVSDAGDAARDEMRRDRRQMMHLCRNPFMLFMVCGTFEWLGHLPPNRGALFATFVDNLLRREEQNSRATGRAWLDAPVIRRGLAALAHAMQQSETGTEITLVEAEQVLTAQPDISDPALLLRLAASANLVDVGERVRFAHQLLQEYFASEVMGAALDEKRSPTEFWPAESWWERQGWEETATILAGVRGDPEAVARWIALAQPEIAYQALTECGIDVNLGEIQAETRAALVDSAHAKKSEMNPIGRAAAYRVLGLLDADKRPGIGLRADGLPDIEWVEIPAGKFIYGDEREKNGPVTLTLPTFYIARYPITYAQFQAFLDAPDGFERDEWWAGLTSRYQEQSMGEQRFKYANHPRENVSWYQAVAFCRWLSAKLGYEVTLPSEQQWEKSARGTDGREYPYGNTFEASKGNTGETGIRQTSAVGIFPDGASPYGVLDLSGNVWEWCLNEYSNPENIALAGAAVRVLRGGPWYFDVDVDAQAAFRGWPNPNLSLGDKGFRVVCSAPMP